MKWEKILKLDLSEASKLTQEYLPEEMGTLEDKLRITIKNSKERKKMREENKNMVLGKIANGIRYLESLGEFPQKKRFMKRYKFLERKVRLSKPWTYNTEVPKYTFSGHLHSFTTKIKDPYNHFLAPVLFELFRMEKDVRVNYASHMA